MKKTLTILLVLVLLLSCLPVGAAAAGGKETKRAIAIVFDDSGSMYLGDQEQRKAWCRATYAAEAFAAMLNKGDKLRVYPMNTMKVETTGQEFSYDNPLEVTKETSSLIHNMYSTQPGDTHIEAIKAACDDILKVSADEYWLVVLTDGDVFYRNGQKKEKDTVAELEKDLSYCREKLNVMYLGMGSQTAMPKEVTGTKYYEAQRTKDGTEVLAALSSMCNTIFERYSLKDVGTTVKFDLPMTNLIVFVQGEGIQNVKLGNLKPMDTKQMRFSDRKPDGETGKKVPYKDSALIDETLQGQLLTFQNVDAGNYALSYDGTATSVDVYYEPDVDVKLELLDAAGNPIKVDGETELIYGTYYISYTLVDKNGNPVPENTTLLGETKYTVKYTLNGKEHTVNSTSGGKIKLEVKQGETLDGASVRVVYLDGVPKERTSAELKWPKWTFKAPEAGLLKAEMSGGSAEYKLSQISAGEAFKAEFFYDGAALTDAQLKKGEKDHLKINIEGGNAGYTYEIKDNAVYVTIKPYEVLCDTQCGEYTVHVFYTYYNDDNKATNQADAPGTFEIKDDSRELGMRFSPGQTYFEISKIGESEPFVLHFDFSGDNLTEAELNALNITYDAEGLTLIKEVKAEESAVHFRLDPSNPPAEGKYKINFTATGVNEIGRAQGPLDCRVTIEVSALPLWLKILIPILIAILIGTLIWLYLNMKVLPEFIKLENESFTIDGGAVAGCTCTFSGAKKKTGKIIVKSGADPAGDPTGTLGITLNVTALTNRVTPVSSKRYRVDSYSLANKTHVLGWELGSKAFEPDPENPSVFVDVNTGKPFEPFSIGANTQFNISSSSPSVSANFNGAIVAKGKKNKR